MQIPARATYRTSGVGEPAAHLPSVLGGAMESLCFPPAGCAGAAGACPWQAQTVLVATCCLTCQRFTAFSSRDLALPRHIPGSSELCAVSSPSPPQPKVLLVAGKVFFGTGVCPAERGVFNATVMGCFKSCAAKRGAPARWQKEWGIREGASRVLAYCPGLAVTV